MGKCGSKDNYNDEDDDKDVNEHQPCMKPQPLKASDISENQDTSTRSSDQN